MSTAVTANTSESRSRIRGARTDDELHEALERSANDTVLVQYGSGWCKQCKAMLPQFINLTRQFPNVLPIVASVERMKEAVKDIEFSPHFAFYRNKRKVDEFYGTNVQRLHDRMWLHNPDAQAPAPAPSVPPSTFQK